MKLQAVDAHFQIGGGVGVGLLEQDVKVGGGTTGIETGQILVINLCVLLHYVITHVSLSVF